MADILSREKRSWNMSRIRGHNTAPERIVRSILHRMGYRYSLKRIDLPGKPDIVLVKCRTVVFVNGCFWHRHKGCRMAYFPKSRKQFWTNKFEENIARDKRVLRDLRKTGWKIIVIWECETEKSLDRLKKKLMNALEKRNVHRR